MGCRCHEGRTRSRGEAPVPEVGERGLLLMQSDNGNGKVLYGPVTGSWYPFDERARLWVDRRDAIYFLSPDLRLA